MNYNGVIIKSLYFTGPHVDAVGVDFKSSVTLVYGASNTGKSFALKSIDFVLGSSSKLPGIDERNGYDVVWVDLDIIGDKPGRFSLSRSFSGGGVSLYERSNTVPVERKKISDLESDHDDQKENNISRFLLKRIGLDGKVVAKNKDGEKGGLSFRDLAISLFVDEKSIQNDKSPIQRVVYPKPTRERRTFRTLITGEDDSAVVPVVPKPKFQASKEGKLEILDEMAKEIDFEIDKAGYDEEPSVELLDKIETEINFLKKSIELAQEPVKELIDEKSYRSSALMSVRSRYGQVNGHLEKFSKLDAVYVSDIERLTSIEESGFLLSIGGDRNCPLCGSTSDVQSHVSSLLEIENMRSASLAEINKIERLRQDLGETVIDLQIERDSLESASDSLTTNLTNIESRIKDLSPNISTLHANIDDENYRKEYLINGISLFNRRENLANKMKEIEKSKSASNKNKPKLEDPSLQLHEFCKDVTDVLVDWGFPGECVVSFDEKNYDIRIDGKLRTDNGKGVRAVTHAAFKVALLVYCRRKNLPHPGFLILDTPLVTYRDPFTSKYGELSVDEITLAATPLKDKFFKHLHSLSHLGQFIIFDNIDPPENIEKLAKLHEFSGAKSSGRYGLFPV